MTRSLVKSTLPIGHILMGAAGWILYAFEPYEAVMALAALLSLLAAPRLLRGSLRGAEARADIKLHASITPSFRVIRVLSVHEKLQWEGRRHPICMVLWHIGILLLTGITVTIGVYASWAVAGIIWGVGLVAFAFRVSLWYRDRLCLTNHRIIEVSGLFTEKVGMMPLKKLTDMTLQVPWHSNILAWLRLIRLPYGTLIVESAGQDQALSRIPFVPNARLIDRLIAEEALD